MVEGNSRRYHAEKLKKSLAELDARLNVLGRNKPAAVSHLAWEIAGELELPVTR
jgi:hypothetical protein